MTGARRCSYAQAPRRLTDESYRAGGAGGGNCVDRALLLL